MDGHTLPDDCGLAHAGAHSAGDGRAGASEDLLQGSFTTWDCRGLKAYIEARMLADEGERQEAPLNCPHTATAYARL